MKAAIFLAIVAAPAALWIAIVAAFPSPRRKRAKDGRW